MKKLLELIKKWRTISAEIRSLSQEIATADVADLAEIQKREVDIDAKHTELATIEAEIEQEETKLKEKIEQREKGSISQIKATNAEKEAVIKHAEIKREKNMNKRAYQLVNDMITRSKDTIQTFAENMKKYQQRDLSGAQFAVPTEIMTVVLDLLEEHEVLKIVDMKKVNGNARVSYFAEFPEAYWTDKAHDKNANQKIYTMDLDAYGVANYLAIDAYDEEDLGTYVTQVIEALVESLSQKIESAIFSGDGSNSPVGIKTYLNAKTKPDYYNTEKQGEFKPVNTTHVKTVEVFGGGAEAYRKLATTLTEVKRHAGLKNMALAMTEKTYKKLELELANSDAGFNAVLVSKAEKELPLLGKVVFTEQLKDDNIVAGYFDAYKLPVRDALKVARSTDYEFADDKVCYKATARLDGRPIFGDCFMDITLTTKAGK